MLLEAICVLCLDKFLGNILLSFQDQIKLLSTFKGVIKYANKHDKQKQTKANSRVGYKSQVRSADHFSADHKFYFYHYI